MSAIKRSVNIAGHATSVTLEPEFWNILKNITERDDISLNALITEIDDSKVIDNLSSAIRLFILDDLKSQILALTEEAP